MLSNSQRSLLELAIAAAKNSSYRYRLGAVVVSGGRVQGVGWSKYKNNPKNVSEHHVHQCSIHAEQDAIREVDTLRRASAFVARLGAFDIPALAKPCDACMTALSDAGVSKVYWTVNGNRADWCKLA